MNQGPRFLSLAWTAALLFSTALAFGADADPKKAEAAQRFDRGLTLFEDGDNAGALAEFKRTYELFPNPVVLYNIGLVYAAMKRPVEAVDALEKVVGVETLSPEQRDRAKLTLGDQKARIGRLKVTTVPEGARIEIDNVEVARTPLAGPLRVAEGSHIIGAVAEGYAPARKEVVIAGNSDAATHLELVSSQGKQLANLTVKTRTPGAEVHIDGQLSGKTPLTTSITLVAGKHAVELRRPGYTSVRKEIELGAGATGELAFELAVDTAKLGSEGVTLALDVTETGSVVFVDEEHKGPYTAPLRLPKGSHRIRVERGGFFPVERDVTLEPGSPNTARIELEPTPEYRTDYESSASFHRTWGWIGIISGAAIAGGGVAWLAINAGPKSDRKEELDAILDARDAREDFLGVDGSDCNTTSIGADNRTGSAELCNALVDSYATEYDDAKAKDIIGYVGLGVGAAALGTGIVLLLTGDDPNKYERKSSESLGKARGPQIGWVSGPGDVGGGLRVAF